jgi:hypothetical protein
LGLIVAGGVFARSALGRPWVVLATPAEDPSGTLAWEIKGWRGSGRLIEGIATELATGVTPSPVEHPRQGTPA